MKKTPLQYGIEGCAALMHQYEAEKLPPEGALFYHQGVFLSGMQHIYELTKDKTYFEYIKRYIDSVIGPNGEVYGICHELTTPETNHINKRTLAMLDCKQPCLLCYGLYDETGDEKYMNVIKTIAQSMYFWPVNQYGGYWHMMTQPYQMWMDGAYMIGPFCAEYAARFGDEILRKRAVKQVILMDDFMKDKETGLYYHGWDDSRKERWCDPETGLSSQFWGRAMGWYTVAILDILEKLPEDYPEAERLKQIERDLLYTLMKYQDKKTGLWYQVIDQTDKEDNWIESSCSYLFMYSYAKAYRMGIVGDEIKEVLERAYQGMEDILYYDEKGYLVIGRVCIGTTIDDGTYEHYINRAQICNDLHGAGAFLLMCAELEKYNRFIEK